VLRLVGLWGLRKGSLARRYAVLVGGMTLVLLVSSGLSEMYFGYREAREQIATLQQVQAIAAAREIEQYLRVIEDGIREAGKFPWGQPRYGLQEKREEFYRLLVLFPAIVELRDVDPLGFEQLFVSRTEPDRLGSRLEVDSAEPSTTLVRAVQYGPTFYRETADPLVLMHVEGARRGAHSTVATINLRFLADVVSGLRIGDAGRTYLVDSANRLIAHPRTSEVLRQQDLSDFQPVKRARRAAKEGNTSLLNASDTIGLDQQPVIATAVRLQRADWLLFVEQPRSEALIPALATLTRTLLLLAFGGGIAAFASMLFARRMAAPIVALREATERVAAGNLDADVHVPGRYDEIQALARDFQHMVQRLRESYSGLEMQVTSRTAELSQARDGLQAQALALDSLNQRLVEQLDEASRRKDEAERANASKTRFLAAASHDLRQPMHSIGLLVSLLGDRMHDPEHQALAKKVMQSVSTMEELFSSLLDISKLDSGVVHPNWETFDVDIVLRRIDRTFAPQAAERQLRFRVRPARALVRSDPVLLERVLVNLVSNALRYTATGGVLVGCRRRGDRLGVLVVDTGAGIPREHLDDIFDEFVRLGTTAFDHAKGLGLGLSIVKRSAEILGHDIAVRSVVAKGSAFELLMPRMAYLAVTETETLPAPDAASAVAGAFVVVVDDDEENLRSMEALCLHWGCSALCAGSTAEVLAALEQHLRTPDLIITDYRIGDGDNGFDLISRLRTAVEEPVPAIVVTADVGTDLPLRAAALDATLLHKPTGSAKLLAAMAAALSSNGSEAQAQPAGRHHGLGARGGVERSEHR
jgi:signal transduction histidine kinase/CheY-like chemotaxis protein